MITFLFESGKSKVQGHSRSGNFSIEIPKDRTRVNNFYTPARDKTDKFDGLNHRKQISTGEPDDSSSTSK